MNGHGKLVLANRRNSVRVNCVAQFRRMSRTMLPCRRSYNTYHNDCNRHYSLIDYFMCSSVMFDEKDTCVSILYDGDNSSDHFAITCDFKFDVNATCYSHATDRLQDRRCSGTELICQVMRPDYQPLYPLLTYKWRHLTVTVHVIMIVAMCWNPIICHCARVCI